MADRIRNIAKSLRTKFNIPITTTTGREKIDQLITKYVPATKVAEFADKLRNEPIGTKVKEMVSRYEKFTGVQEIMAIQNTVIDAQERFVTAQDRRRELGRQLASIEERLKELHAEMQNTMKGDDKYLQLCTEEHKLIIQERIIRTHFSDAEREERDLFARMSAAVKLGHERERAHAERNKYWYIVASIFGTVLGIAGSTINNRLKMAEFRDMMEQQMARSASVLYTVAGGAGASRADINEAMKTEFAYQLLGIAGSTINNRLKMAEFRDMMEQQMARSASVLYTVAGGAGASRADINEAMKTEFAYQEQLATNLAQMQDNINNLVNKQSSLIEHLNQQEHYMATQIRDLKKLVVAASQSSAKSDAELAKALSVVHQDLDDENDRRDKDDIQNRVVLEPQQVITGVGVIMLLAIVLGNIISRS